VETLTFGDTLRVETLPCLIFRWNFPKGEYCPPSSPSRGCEYSGLALRKDGFDDRIHNPARGLFTCTKRGSSLIQGVVNTQECVNTAPLDGLAPRQEGWPANPCVFTSLRGGCIIISRPLYKGRTHVCSYSYASNDATPCRGGCEYSGLAPGAVFTQPMELLPQRWL
jgi:hypothetical protein